MNDEFTSVNPVSESEEFACDSVESVAENNLVAIVYVAFAALVSYALVASFAILQ